LKHLTLCLLLLVLLASSISIVKAETGTWYMRSDTQTVREISGYKLSETQSSSSTNDVRTKIDTVAYNVSYGVRVWNVDWNETETELTSGTPIAIVSRTNDGNGLQSGSWAYSSSTILDVVEVRLYQKFGNLAWSQRAIFVCGDEASFKQPTFTFYYYTQRITAYNEVTEKWNTTAVFRWGSSTYNSRVGLSYTEPHPWERMMHELGQGDFVGFTVFPYVYVIGNLVYGFALLGLGMTLYKRSEDLVVPALALMLFGGTGGIITMLIPEAGLYLGWFIFMLGLAILFFRLVKGIG